MAQRIPRVALVGRPNVGKSSLFNRLIRARQAIVSDVPGTTRDRLTSLLTIKGTQIELVDMAGIEPALKEKNEISQGMQLQVEQALRNADVIMWVVDSKQGVTHQDEIVAELLRRLNKDVFIVVNKSDGDHMSDAQFEFTRFGFRGTFPVSALHNKGIQDLFDALSPVIAQLATDTNPERDLHAESDKELQVAILGRPNVGKSTLLNALTESKRAVVSPIAGTTRDAVDDVIPASRLFGRTFTQWEQIRIVDTAGIRRPGKIVKGRQGIEGWSVIRTLETLDRAELAFLVIDATEKLVHQDLQVVEKIIDAGRPIIIVINKWDLILAKTDATPGTDEDAALQETFLTGLREQASFLFWAPVIFISALEGINLRKIGSVALRCYQAWSTKVDRRELLEVSRHVRSLPRLSNVLAISYEHSQPPTFHIHTQGKEVLHFSLRRQIEHILREVFGIGPTPIKIWNARTATAKAAKELLDAQGAALEEPEELD
jgi:GTPase